MNLTKGQIVYMGGNAGRVMRKFGAHAVQVWTSFAKSDQDFLTHKITQVTGFRAETWPVKSITTSPTETTNERKENG